MTMVRIPATLRTATGGAKRVEVDASTVGQAIDALVAAYPALRDPLVAPDGGIHRFVNVYVDDVDVRHLDGTATALDDRAVLTILPAMAGGY